MFTAYDALYKAETKVIHGDAHTNSAAPDGTVVIGYLYYDVNTYKIKTIDCVRGFDISYEIDPNTVGMYTGLRLDNKIAMGVNIFVNDVILDVCSNKKAIVIYDNKNYSFAVKTDDNQILPFTEWDWRNTRVIDYKPSIPEKFSLKNVIVPDERLNMSTPAGVFKAQAYKQIYDNNCEYAGVNVEFVSDYITKPNISVKLELVGETERVRVLIYDDNSGKCTKEHIF